MHGARLTALARDAEQAEARGALAQAASAWREALDLLPPEAGQIAQVRARLETLGRRIEREGPGSEAAAEPATRSRWGAGVGALTGVALLAWKLKALLLLALGKAKVFLLGLTKLSTLLSMLASVGVYWTVWGWRFALGLVASIYVHEMGHVFALRRFGIAASAPMFVPGLGAFIRSQQAPTTERESARVGLAGPLWGLGATLATYLAHLATGWESFAAIARVGAWLNLFNLLPVAMLDGGRGFSSLTRPQRGLASAVLAAIWLVTREGLVLLLLACAALFTFVGRPAKEPDWAVLVQYTALAAMLAAATLIPVEVAL